MTSPEPPQFPTPGGPGLPRPGSPDGVTASGADPGTTRPRGESLDLGPYGGGSFPPGLAQATRELLQRIRHVQSRFECTVQLVPVLGARLEAGESAAQLQALLESKPLRQLATLGGRAITTLIERRAPQESIAACQATNRRLARFYAPRLSRAERDLGLAEVWDDPGWVQPGGGPVGGGWTEWRTRRRLVRETRRRGTAHRGWLTRGWRFLQRWIPRALLLLGLVWGTLAGWLMWAEPAESRPPAIQLRQTGTPLAVEDRAWPLLKAWWLRVHDQPRFNSDKSVWRQPSSPVPSPGVLLTPELVAELQQERDAVEVLLQAAQRVGLGHDPTDQEPLPNYQSLDVFVNWTVLGNTGPPGQQPANEVAGLLGQALRELEARYALALADSDLTAAGRLLVARVQFCRLLTESLTQQAWWLRGPLHNQILLDLENYTERLRTPGVVVGDPVIDSLRRSLGQFEQSLVRKQDASWTEERTAYLDSLYTRAGVGLVTRQGLRDLAATGALWPVVAGMSDWEWVGPDQALLWLEQNLRAPVAAGLIATRSAVEQADDQIEQQVVAHATKYSVSQATARAELLDASVTGSRWRRIRWAPLLMVHAGRASLEQWMWNPSFRNLRRALIRVSAIAYQRRTGAWPRQVSDLVPTELEAIPEVPESSVPVDLDWADAVPWQTER